MANKTIITRIKNKVDTLAAWNSYTGTLLNGEIAVVRVPTGTSYTNPVTGKTEPVVELLMKVGDGTSTFANLPWMSAKASDVYDWAKAATVVFDTTDYKIKFKDAAGSVIAKATIDLSSIDSRLIALEGKDITVTPSASTNGVVQSVTNGDDHEIEVTYGLVQKADIATGAVDADQIAANAVVEGKIAADAVTEGKIKNGAVTVDKIGTGAVTNVKLGSDISSDKINIDSKTLTAKIGEMDADILTAKTHATSAHNYLPTSTKYAGSDTVGGVATEAKKVSNKLSVQLNGGTATEFDGSAVKSINITPSAIGAASQTDVFGTDGNGGLKGEVLQNAADILAIRNSIKSGVNFRGTTTTALTDGATTKIVVIDNKNYPTSGELGTDNAGDIVIYNNKEFIWTGSAWEELGDLTVAGELAEWRQGLNYTTITDGAATNNKFVTKVTQSDGKIAVTYARPAATDVSYGTSNVSDALGALDANKVDKTTYDNHSHTISAGAEDDDVVVLTGTAGTNGVSYKATHAASGVTAGTYRSVTVDAKGHVTAGTNPTTLAGYGITDAYTKTEVYTKSDVYTKGEVNAELEKKADKSTTYTKTEVDTAIGTAKTDAATDASNKVAVALAEAQAYAAGLDAAMDTRVDALETAKESSDAAFANIRSTYVRYTQVGTTNNYQMHLGTDTDVIIFDCGGASD